MKFLNNRPQSLNSKFIFDADKPGQATETVPAKAERAMVHQECQKDCKKLSTNVEAGLTTPVATAKLNLTGKDGNETVTGQAAEDKISTDEVETEKLSPHTATIDALKTQPEYKEIDATEFNTARDAVTTAITNGELKIPKDIADDPDKVNDWLNKQVDIKLENQETDPEARVQEFMAGKGRTVSREQQQQYTRKVKEFRQQNSNAPKSYLHKFIEHFLRELGLLNDDEGLFYEGDNGFEPYKGPAEYATNGNRNYNGKVFKGDFELNTKFYDLNKLKADLKAESPNRFQEAEKAAERFSDLDKDWQAALFRNALNNENFKASGPIVLHNISTATAAVWIPGEGANAFLVPATHGYGGVGNKGGGGASSLGSFQLYDMPDGGKFRARMGMRGLEPKKKNFQTKPDKAYGIDPAAVGNSNADARLERTHEIRGRRTAGCTGLPLDVANRVDNALESHRTGVLERFVSNMALKSIHQPKQ